MPEMMACSMSSSVTIQCLASVNDERTWIVTPWLRAYSTERSAITARPHAASSSISSYETCVELARFGDDARVGACKTPSTSV